MNEAHGMADVIVQLLQNAGARDDGAQYAIIVTDTAGNVAEVTFDVAEPRDDKRWIWEEGCFLDRLSLRLRRYVSEQRDRIRYVRLPGRAYEALRHLSAVLTENAATGAGNDADLRKQLQDAIDSARWIA